ncbi:glycosyltransferase family 92 protein [Gluconobacter sp. LMG 31484]|uniref:Glycosyltransferase family 92 protein n=1 Tax=Gluconobacter vitians TaxID=2728102 RepID=A0ABR9Y4T8_9PROT|nr:glycosyltransferase family 2 protein [Gluconobacter vitians]MBF0858781.1 glycosyltransferase family 92 protein [Gluconobacter vitians]
MKVAVCLIVRDEEKDILEWISYYNLIGFDCQIIFDNKSSDKTAGIIKKASEKINIIYNYFPHDRHHCQNAAYEEAIQRYRNDFDWIAFFDSDEFFSINDGTPLKVWLADFEAASAIGVNWAIYGSSGHEDYPPGLVTENFLRRAPQNFGDNKHVKSIVRPERVRRCLNPHAFELENMWSDGYRDTANRKIEWLVLPETGTLLPGVVSGDADWSTARVNHYFTRSFAHWKRKLERGYFDEEALRKIEQFKHFDRNEILDESMKKYSTYISRKISELENLF